MDDGFTFAPVLTVSFDIGNEAANSVQVNNSVCTFHSLQTQSIPFFRSRLGYIDETTVKKTRIFSATEASSASMKSWLMASWSGIMSHPFGVGQRTFDRR